MSKRLELVDVETMTVAVAELYWKEAPNYSAAIWDAFATPMRVQAVHTSVLGKAVVLELPGDHQVFDPTTLPNENVTVTPLPGEIAFRYYPPYSFADPQRPNEGDSSTALWLMAIVYGRDCRFFTQLGWQPMTVFGAIREGMTEFAKCCERIRSDGAKPLEIQRLPAAKPAR